ncbi:hypothetical protein [Streptomyces lavendulae]|uniref:hypothetical protein n=1 Tax=Streptomyces lavendulae TaxID=1914 RepID=UPI0024A56468|nr:hypothetical protein [Streptomyces lavendulae]GLW03723.1 hypothetical protein Slala05_73530 [Streptomyces lavendulae subsp. lavendulae]
MSAPEDPDGNPWEPFVGQLVKDGPTGRLGTVMDYLDDMFHVRPVGGGYEFQVHPTDARKPNEVDQLRVRLGVKNSSDAFREQP